MKTNTGKIISFLCLFSLLISCTNSDTGLNPFDKSPQIRINHPPTSATFIFESDTVLINTSVGISCIVEDPDENENFTFEWSSFKATENSTADNYVLDYWKNRGEFIQAGPKTLWMPAMAAGKYIILCVAKDKGGADIAAAKIIHARVGFGLTLVTDTLLYYTNGMIDENNLLAYTLTNHSDIIFGVNYCGSPVYWMEKKEPDGWKRYSGIAGFCSGDTNPYGPFHPNSTFEGNTHIPPDPGIYRLIVPYSIYPARPWDKDLYSGEFEVVLR